jgi:hypothetical protein
MTTQAVNMTARLLSHAAKQSFLTAFCQFFILYGAQALGNDCAVSIALAPSGRKQPLQKIVVLSLKKIVILEFSFKPWRIFPASFSEIHRRKWLRHRMG